MNIRYPLKLSPIICVAFCVLLFMYGRPVGFLLYTKWQIRNEPKLWNVPRPCHLGLPSRLLEGSFHILAMNSIPLGLS